MKMPAAETRTTVGVTLSLRHFACLAILVGSVQSYVVEGNHHRTSSEMVSPRTITPENRTLCPETPENKPVDRVNTTERVAALRNAMLNTTLTGGAPLQAYIILLQDEHGTSGSEHDRRLKYISGFSGSNGYGIVTSNKAAVWTDGRYFLQADMELDCQWILMKMGQPGYPTGEQALLAELPANSLVGAYPNYVSVTTWQSYEYTLKQKNITMVAVPRDLVDVIWTDNRPAQPNNALIVHTIEFTGLYWWEKLAQVRQKMTENNAEVLVVTALEESAWLFNLRGSDRTNSLFYAYSIITLDQARLYLNNNTALTDSEEVRHHLRILSNGACNGSEECVQVREYSSVMDDVRNLSQSDQIIWISPTASYAVYEAAGSNRYVTASPIELMKSTKNSVERKKFAECIKRDSAAVVEFAAFMEKEIEAQRTWTELEASQHLASIRRTYEHNIGVSFETIAAVGANAAIIHYRPKSSSTRQISNTEVFLLDSGGQYLDGTTDVTRTFHYGTPTETEKEAYTRVLIGAIDLALAVWPEGVYGRDIDGRARGPLWEHGWDYNHGTGHGIGYFLSVHEGPGRISHGYNPDHEPLYDGMFFSDEPGYYEENVYGIRLETLLSVEKADTPNRFGGKQYLMFKPATLVPFEPKMIKTEMLSTIHRRWLNEYHARCESETGDYLLNVRDNQAAYDWLVARTIPIPETDSITSGSRRITSYGVPLLLWLATMLVCLRQTSG